MDFLRGAGLCPDGKAILGYILIIHSFRNCVQYIAQTISNFFVNSVAVEHEERRVEDLALHQARYLSNDH